MWVGVHHYRCEYGVPWSRNNEVAGLAGNSPTLGSTLSHFGLWDYLTFLFFQTNTKQVTWDKDIVYS